jgi:hypothetical protein
MKTHLRIIAMAVAVLVIVAARIVGVAGQQQSTFHKPMAPIGPTSEAQCQALEGEWSAVCGRISAAHQQCLDANADSKIPGAGNCSKAPCLALHKENDSCGGAERSNAVSACRASVRAHQEREAAFRAAQEAAVRAQQEAERARRERMAAEAARYRAEENAARRRREEYLRNTPRSGGRPDLDRRQASLVADLRSEADRKAASLVDARPLPGPAPAPAPPAPYEPIENATLPELSSPLEFVSDLADDLELPAIKHSADMLNWFAKIHDGRRAEVEGARERFNEAFRRERPNDVNFNYDECTFLPAYCYRVIDGLSFEAKERFKEYNQKMKRYLAWTDLGNITGEGWSEQEKKDFLRSIGGTAGDAIKDKVSDWIDKKNPKRKDQEETQKIDDIVNRNFQKGLEHFFPTPSPSPSPSPSPRPTTPPAWNLSDEAFAKYREDLKQWLQKQKQPQRSEPDMLEQLLKQMPSVPVPISTPLPPDVTTRPRG